MAQGKLLFFSIAVSNPQDFPHVQRLRHKPVLSLEEGESRRHSCVAGINSIFVCMDFCKVTTPSTSVFPNSYFWLACLAGNIFSVALTLLTAQEATPSAAKTQGVHSTV